MAFIQFPSVALKIPPHWHSFSKNDLNLITWAWEDVRLWACCYSVGDDERMIGPMAYHRPLPLRVQGTMVLKAFPNFKFIFDVQVGYDQKFALRRQTSPV